MLFIELCTPLGKQKPVYARSFAWVLRVWVRQYSLSLSRSSALLRRLQFPSFVPHSVNRRLDVMNRGVWSAEEHARFLVAIREYPHGPWGQIAAHIGTRSARQVQTHAQRYQEKIQRHARGLRRLRLKSMHKEHRIDEDVLRAHMDEASYKTKEATAHSAYWEQSDIQYQNEFQYPTQYPTSPTEVNHWPWVQSLPSPTWRSDQYQASYQSLTIHSFWNKQQTRYEGTRAEFPPPPTDVLLSYLPKKSPRKALSSSKPISL